MINILRLCVLLLVLATTDALAVFPTTGVLDDFNRANENPLLSFGTPWGVRIQPGCSGSEGGDPRCTMRIVSNGLMDDSANDGEGSGSTYRDDQNYGPGSEVYVTFTTMWGAAGSDFWFWIDGNAEETTGLDGYKFYTYYNTGSWYYYTVRVDNNVGTELVAGDQGTTPANGDALGAEHNGSTLTWYRKPSGGSWGALDVATASDSTYTSGHIGLSKGYADTTSVLDDFGGGTIVTASPSVPRMMLLGVQ